MKRRIFLVFLTIVAVTGLVFAQTRTSLTIQSNQTGAQVYLNDALLGYTSPNFSALVTPGSYVVRVVKEGFAEFKSTVVVGTSPVTIVATLGGSPGKPPSPKPPAPPVVQKHSLNVDSNMRGAQVYINGSFSGVTPYSAQLLPGTYTVMVRMDGYEDFSSIVKLTGTNRVFASLSPRSFPVYIDAAVSTGASVYRDSVFLGTLPYRGSWIPGSYTIRITAPGYTDYTERVFVSGPLTMQLSMTPAIVSYELRIPEFFASLSGRRLEFRDMLILLDGKRLESPYGTVVPGNHRIDIYIGDFAFNASFDVPSGPPVIIEPFLGVRVR
jgi:hypothetical protein